MNKTTSFAFTHTAKGIEIAYRYSPAQMRFFRVGLDEAKLAIATGSGVRIEYINYRNGVRVGN
jgi:hypothetical protein